MAKIEFRFPKLFDAKKYCEILNNPNFLYFVSKPTLVQEKKWIQGCEKRRKNNFDHSYAILLDGKLVGGCGIKIDQHRTYIGEIGYFIDEAYWGKGIACKAVQFLENFGFQKLKLHRLTILMRIENKASERVAIKCGYKKEGIEQKSLEQNKKYYDCFMYAKVK